MSEMTEMLPDTRRELAFLCEDPTIRVLMALRDGPRADVDLEDRAGLKRVAASARLQRLHALGLVTEAGHRPPQGKGRPAKLWALTEAVKELESFARVADAFILELLGRRHQRQERGIAERRRDELG